MVSRGLRKQLAEDVALWQVDGLVSPDQAERLRVRYQARAVGLAGAARTLGIAGAVLAGFGLLGALAAMSGSLALGALELLAVAVALLAWGLRLARDPEGRAEQSSRAMLAVGILALAGAGAAAAGAADAGPALTLLPWILTALAAALAQVLLGAREKSALILGFGVTALCVTFYFQFVAWRSGDLWFLHLLVLGGALLAGGMFLERSLRTRRADAEPRPSP